MQIEDQLSKTAQVFQSMLRNPQRKAKIPGSKKIQPDDDKKTVKQKPVIKYVNNDILNLRKEESPTKIKITPRPLPEQYRRQHIFIQ